jgi:hypothetical protein
MTSGICAVHHPLKLRYAVEHDWQPGVWTAADLRGVEQGPARRKWLPAFTVK